MKEHEEENKLEICVKGIAKLKIASVLFQMQFKGKQFLL